MSTLDIKVIGLLLDTEEKQNLKIRVAISGKHGIMK